MWTEVKTCSQLDISWAQKRVPSCFLQLASSATRKQLHTCELNTQRFLRKFHCIVVQKIEQLQKLRCCNDTPDYASWQNSHSQIDHIDYEFTACTSKSILGPILAPFKRHFSHFKFVLKVYLGGLLKKICCKSISKPFHVYSRVIVHFWAIFRSIDFHYFPCKAHS